MKISNPIFKELIKLKIINKSNLIKISNQTRDKTIPVYKDQKSKVIFLEKYRKEAYRLAYELRKNSKNYFVHINFTADMAIEKQLKKSSRLDSEYIITIENNNEAKITDKFKKTKIFKVSSIEDIKKIIF